VLIRNKQIEEALLVCDRGRARALGDLLFSKYGINNENAPRVKPLEYTDIEMVLLTKNYSILSFAFNKSVVVWILAPQKPLVFIKCENQLSNSEMKSEEGEEKDMELFCSKIINNAYDTDKGQHSTSEM
jgi:hypothetical protein